MSALPAFLAAAISVFAISIAIVIGPTPPVKGHCLFWTIPPCLDCNRKLRSVSLCPSVEEDTSGLRAIRFAQAQKTRHQMSSHWPG